MANKELEVQQLLKAYRKGIISQELFAKEMTELGATGNGNGAATMSQSKAPSQQKAPRMRGVTGDPSIDSGALFKAMKGKTYDRAAGDLGNIVALEHVNVTVPDQEK